MRIIVDVIIWIIKILIAAVLFAFFLGVIIAVITEAYQDTACAPQKHAPLAGPTPLNDQEAIAGYVRETKTTVLTIPEWYIVYSAREYGTYLSKGLPPSEFHFGESFARFWCLNGFAKAEAAQVSTVAPADSLMLNVIGGSYSGEYAIKMLYERSVGRVFELIGGSETPEDMEYARITQDYAAFLQETPWYDYPFFSKFIELWKTPTHCPVNARSCERRVYYSIELLFKALYGKLIGYATHATYSPAESSTELTVNSLPATFEHDARVTTVKRIAEGVVISVPRYQAFTDLMQAFAQSGVVIHDFAGNDHIAVSVVVPSGLAYTLSDGTVVLIMETVDGSHRYIVDVPAMDLGAYIRGVDREGFTLEHVYDY